MRAKYSEEKKTRANVDVLRSRLNERNLSNLGFQKLSEAWPFQSCALSTPVLLRLLNGEFVRRIEIEKLAAILRCTSPEEIINSDGGLEAAKLSEALARTGIQGSTPEIAAQLSKLSKREEFSGSRVANNTLRAALSGSQMNRTTLVKIARVLGVDPSEIIVESSRPYKGLESFKLEDAQYFIGRESKIDEIISELDSFGFVSLIGASGSGKSSVLHAGVAATLYANSTTPTTIISMTPGEQPKLNLEQAFADSDSESSYSEADLSGPLLQMLARFKARLPRGTRLVLIVDQWEEIYTQVVEPDQRSEFLEFLVQARDEGLAEILLGVRADFYGDLFNLTNQRFVELASLGHVQLPNMSADELRDAIMLPAADLKYEFEEGLVEVILGDAAALANSASLEASGDLLPLLQVCLASLWDGRKQTPKRLITLARYAAIGGLKGSIDAHAETAFAELHKDQKLIAQSVLPYLVGRTNHDRLISSPKRKSDFTADEYEVLQVLGASRNWLVRFDHDGDGSDPIVAIAHEALPREWIRLLKWVNDQPEISSLLSEISRRKQFYDVHGSRPSDLLTGSVLLLAEKLVERQVNGFFGRADGQPQPDRSYHAPEKIRHFVETSLIAHQQSQELEAQSENSRARISRIARLSSVGALVSFIIVAALVWLNNESTKAAIADSSRILASAATSALSVSGTKDAIALAIMSLPRDPTDVRPVLPEAMEAISQVLSSESAATQVIKLRSPIAQARFRGDGEGVISVLEDLSILNWTSGERGFHPLGHGIADKFQEADVSPNGDYIVIRGSRNDHFLIDTQTGAHVGPDMNWEGVMLSFKSDPAKFFNLGRSEQYFWNSKYSKLSVPQFALRDGAVQAVVSQDGSKLFYRTETNQVVSIQVSGKTYSEIGRLAFGPLKGMAFNPSGTQFVVWDGNGNFQQFSSAMIGEQGAAETINGRIDEAFYVSDSEFVIIPRNANASKWNLAANRPNRVAMDLVKIEQARYTLSADKTVLAIWPDGTDVSIIDLISGKRVLGLTPPKAIAGATISIQGNKLLAWSNDLTVWMYDLRDRSHRKPGFIHNGATSEVSISPDGSRAFARGPDNTLALWNASTGQSIWPEGSRAAGEFGATFSPDGKYLVASSSINGFAIWTANDGKLIYEGNLSSDSRPYSNGSLNFEFSMDGRRLAVLGEGVFQVLDLPLDVGSVVSVLTRYRSLLGAEFIPNSAFLTGWRGSEQGDNLSIYQWDLESGKERLLSNMPLDGSLNDMAWNSTANTLLASSMDGVARLLKADTGQLLHEMRHTQGAIGAAIFNLDKSEIITFGVDEYLKIWDASNGRLVGDPLELKALPAGLKRADNSDRFIIWYWDGTAEIGDLNKPGDKLTLIAHEDTINGAAFSKDENTVISWSRDGTVRFWDVKSGLQRATPIRFPSRVQGVVISPNFEQLFAWTATYEVEAWEMPDLEKNMLHAACDTISNYPISEVAEAYKAGDPEPICSESQRRVFDALSRP